MPFPPGVGGGRPAADASINSYEVITTDRAIDENNVGNRMLRSMGWHEGLVMSSFFYSCEMAVSFVELAFINDCTYILGGKLFQIKCQLINLIANALSLAFFGIYSFLLKWNRTTTTSFLYGKCYT